MHTDSFPAFAMKALQAARGVPEGGRLAYLEENEVRFNGAKINRTMLTAINVFESKIDEHGRKVMGKIETLFGREVMTSGYVKLMRVVQVCSKEADTSGEPPAKFVNFFLEYLSWALRFEMAAPKDVTAEWLDKSKDGKPGAVPVALCKIYIVLFVAGLVGDLKKTGMASQVVADLEAVLPHFDSYVKFEKAFPLDVQVQDNAHVTNAGPGDEQLANDDLDPVERMRKNKGKAGVSAINFLYDLFSGVYNDQICQEVQKEPVLTKISWPCVDTLQGLKELTAQLQIHKSVVRVNATDPPPASTRTLKRYGTEEGADNDGRDAEIQRERVDAWKQAQAVRRKLVTISACKYATKQHLDTHFEKSAAYKFNGKAAESHRVFVFSAEMLHEAQDQPWANAAEWVPSASVAVEWIMNQQGNSDVLLFMDGRSKACRKKLESLTANARHASEVWIVFKSSPRLGRKKSWASDNRETAIISWPVNRSHIPVKQREGGEFAGAGEETTHEVTYTGVQPVPWHALPCLPTADKGIIFGHEPQVANAPPSSLTPRVLAAFFCCCSIVHPRRTPRSGRLSPDTRVAHAAVRVSSPASNLNSFSHPCFGPNCRRAGDKRSVVVGQRVGRQVPRQGVYDTSGGQPLFWGERKSPALWARMLTDLDAKSVVDLTPGSGACARACLTLGVPYLGLVRSAEHASWLQNVMDRQALKSIVESGSPLFEQDLSALLKEHFQDVLDQLNEADKLDDDHEPEDD